MARQVEVTQPIMKTVGNISDTIGSSEFIQVVTIMQCTIAEQTQL